MSDPHKHVYEIVRNEPPWWRRLLGATRTVDYRCRICLRNIGEVIAELEALQEQAVDRLDRAIRNLGDDLLLGVDHWEGVLAAMRRHRPSIHCGDETCTDDHG